VPDTAAAVPSDYPSTPPLGTCITRPRPGAVVLVVDGEIDTLTAPPMERAVGEMFADPRDDVLVIDLSEVTFLASSGLAVLIRAAHRAAERNLRLRLVTRSRAVRRPVEVTGSDRLFDMHQDVAVALGTGR
jgi:anti-sigma B factor antagonist